MTEMSEILAGIEATVVFISEGEEYPVSIAIRPIPYTLGEALLEAPLPVATFERISCGAFDLIYSTQVLGASVDSVGIDELRSMARKVLLSDPCKDGDVFVISPRMIPPSLHVHGQREWH